MRCSGGTAGAIGNGKDVDVVRQHDTIKVVLTALAYSTVTRTFRLGRYDAPGIPSSIFCLVVMPHTRPQSDTGGMGTCSPILERETRCWLRDNQTNISENRKSISVAGGWLGVAI